MVDDAVPDVDAMLVLLELDEKLEDNEEFVVFDLELLVLPVEVPETTPELVD